MKTTKEEREAARLYAAHNTTRYNLTGLLDDLDTLSATVTEQATEIGRLREENGKMRESLEYIARTDVTDSAPDLIWLSDWRNTRKQSAKRCLASLKEGGNAKSDSPESS